MRKDTGASAPSSVPFLRHRWVWFFLGTFFGAVPLYGLSFFQTSHSSFLQFAEEREQDKGYSFVNPLLACGEDTSSLLNDRVRELEQKTFALIQRKKASSEVNEVAVYFRQFGSGPWFGISEDTRFVPGSLLKVPLAMSIYRLAEDNPALLQQKILYEGGSTSAVEHYTSKTITPGSTYSVLELVNATLQYSDNNAALLLTQLIPQTELNNSYSRLGITVPVSGADYDMTVRTYASFFRILYNTSYIGRHYSEAMLKTLSEATFVDGLVAGVPAGVAVAHKFGERSYGSGLVQLHDCGVVYKPGKPYLLCVMTRGTEFEKLAAIIKDISALVYEYAE